MAVRGEKHDRRRNGCRPDCLSLLVDCKGCDSCTTLWHAPQSAFLRFVFRMLRSASRNSGLATATPRRSQASVLPRARSRHAVHRRTAARQRWPSALPRAILPIHSCSPQLHCRSSTGSISGGTCRSWRRVGSRTFTSATGTSRATRRCSRSPRTGPALSPKPSRTVGSAISALPSNADSIVTCALWPLCTYLCADSERPRYVPSAVQCAAAGRIW